VSLTASQRRNAELGLGLLAVVITVGGYILVALAAGPSLPPNIWFFLAVLVGLYVAAHLAVHGSLPEPTARCCRSPRCSTASGSWSSRASTVT